MNIKSQKRIAADVLDVGYNRVWVDPDYIDEVSLALTREDIRKLIHDGIIRTRSEKGTSKGRFRYNLRQKRRGQRKGHGSRSGTAEARYTSKRKWMDRIRAQRKYLKALRDNGQLDRSDYRKYYLKIKGGSFRNVTHLKFTLKDAELIKKPVKETVRR